MTKSLALEIPTFAACIEIISNTVASLPIVLYKETEGKVEVINDKRINLLNDETGDTLDSFQFKKAMIKDYLIYGAAYGYINKLKGNINSLHYVDNISVSIMNNQDPIFKDSKILINGANYETFEFVILTRNSKNGTSGTGIVKENNDILSVAYNTLDFENNLVATGGNKKGFLKSVGKLSEEAKTTLKQQWNNLYKNNNENVVILNNGLDFKEASNTSVEMQLAENKKVNAIEICKLFNIPPTLLEGKATEEEYLNFIKLAISPILRAFETAINKSLLKELEKSSFYFAFDTKELLKGDIEKRFRSYSEAVKAGWISKNEIRYIEDLPRLNGLDVVTLSLGEVIFDINNQKYFTPNTDSIADLKGGENNKNRDKE